MGRSAERKRQTSEKFIVMGTITERSVVPLSFGGEITHVTVRAPVANVRHCDDIGDDFSTK